MAFKRKNEFSERFLLWFAASTVAICFIYIFLITFATVPEKNQRYADVCLGFLLGTFLATILQYYFGASHNSVKKEGEKTPTELLAETKIEEVKEEPKTEVKAEEEKKPCEEKDTSN